MSRTVRVAAELALVALTIAAAASLRRLFVDWDFFADLVVFAVLAHASAIAVRRLGGGLVVSTATSVIALAFATGWVLYPESLNSGLPTLATRDLARADLDVAWELFGQVKAPTIATGGFVLISAVGIWLVAFLADWAAFRVPSAVEALIPSSTLFVFVTLFAAPHFRSQATVLFGAAAVVFVLLHRVMRESGPTTTWLGGGAVRGTSALIRTGVIVGLVAIVGGLVAGPRLPGAEANPVINWRDAGAGAGSRVVISPLVSIQAQLVTLSDVEVFTVKTDQPDYWRLTSLDIFNGSVWESSGSFSQGGNSLPSTLPVNSDFEVVRQTFSMKALGQIWLPAAFEPSAVVDPGGADPLYEAASGTLVIGRDGPDVSDGITYVVESKVPSRSLAAIAGASGEIPAEIADRYLQLPDDFSQRVTEAAQTIVDAEGAVTPYDKAKALQDFFQREFVYDLDVAAGHSAESIEEFVFDVRRGYCEQFASSFAAMARSIGLPSRVAVGFTPGELDGDIYRVRGEHAHAWPEVWIADIGWLRFEPTPGRGAPGDTEYTGLDPAQAVAQEPTSTETVPVPTTVVPGGSAPSTIAPSDRLDDDSGGFDSAQVGTGGWGSFTQWMLRGVLALAAMGVAGIGLVQANARARRHLYRGSHAGNRERISGAWEESLAYLELADISRSIDETPYEFAHRAGKSIRSRVEIERLADLTTLARYAADTDVSEADLEHAKASAHAICTEVCEGVSRRKLMAWQLNPKPLLRNILPGR